MKSEPINLGKFSPDDPAWHELRRTGIGASEAASILGVEGAFSTPLQIWASKRGILVDEKPSERLADFFHFGHIMEPIIAAELARRTQLIVERDGHTYRHPQHEFLLATPDAWADHIAGARGQLAELKNVSEWAAGDWDEEPPAKYQVQLQHQMLVMGADRGVLAALVGGNRFLWWQTEASPAFHEMLINKLGEFWEKVKNNDQPLGSGKDVETLKRLHSADPEKVVELPTSVIGLDSELQATKEEIKALGKRKDELEARLWEAMGDAEVGVLPDGGGYKVIQMKAQHFTVDKDPYKYLRRFKK